jgi:hypothetical protein
MKTVKLKASGYTWNCPECRKANYVGPAGITVQCEACNGKFAVAKIVHRRANGSPSQPPADNQRGKEPDQINFQPNLFPAQKRTNSKGDMDDDIPF